MVNSKYSLEAYSDKWPAQFEHYALQLPAALGVDNLLAVYHIGSTSVPGLTAKPIIDMMPIVRDITLVERREVEMEDAGYSYWGEYGLPGRRYFTLDHDGVRKVNCHIYQADNPERIRHIAFPAYLRAHPEICREYVEVKRAAIAAHNADINAYNDHKDPWIKAHEPLALAWYLRGTSAETSPNRE